MYHNITPNWTDDIFTVQENLFAEHLHWLQLTGHQPVTLAQIASWLDGQNSLPARAYLITFDDGYLDNLERALPLLQRFHATACIFVTTNWCDAGKSSPGARKYPMLTWAHLRQLAEAGVEIGAHTLSHPFLTDVEPTIAWKEIYNAKRVVEDHLGREVHAFSYPNSKHNITIRDMVRKAGYQLAFGGSSGLCHKHTDRYNLYRPCIYNNCKLSEFILSICTGFDVRARYRQWRNQRRIRYIK
jgi:peptidoglycan/xylan/chitin deacetylase (PgdA/CDA1 family)